MEKYTKEEWIKINNAAELLSQVTGFSKDAAIDSITLCIEKFNKESFDKLSHSSENIINKFVAVDSQFSVSSKDLAESIERVGGAGKECNVSLDELIALTAAAHHLLCRDGKYLGNGLKTIITRLSRPEIVEELKILGIGEIGYKNEATSRVKIVIQSPVVLLKEIALNWNSWNSKIQDNVGDLISGPYQRIVFYSIILDLQKQQSSVYIKVLNELNKMVKQGN